MPIQNYKRRILDFGTGTLPLEMGFLHIKNGLRRGVSETLTYKKKELETFTYKNEMIPAIPGGIRRHGKGLYLFED